MSKPIAARRAALGEAGIYSVNEAAKLIPGNDKRCKEWLEEQGLVRQGPAGGVVLWREVLAALAKGTPALDAAGLSRPTSVQRGRRRRRGSDSLGPPIP